MSSYEGQSRNGVRHGFGSLLHDNGDRYIGEWREGVRHGLGVYLSKSGDTYYGQYNNGKWHGFGFMELSNGERRFGEWVDNKFHGLNIGKKGDEYEIGRSAVRYKVPVITTISAAQAAIRGIRNIKSGSIQYRSLQEVFT